MKTEDFLKDFIGDKEIVTVRAIQLKELLLQNENKNLCIEKMAKENEILKKTINVLRQQIAWEESKKLRHIDLKG